MTSKWRTSGYAAPGTSTDIDVAGAAFTDGIDTIASDFSGSTDPSTSASWGAAHVGFRWRDTTDAYNPVYKVWSKLDAVPNYGWKNIRPPVVKFLTTPLAVTFTTTSPQTGDVAYEDVDLTTALASGRDSDAAVQVRAVQLFIKIAESGAIAAGDAGFLEVRTKGGTNIFPMHPKVSGKSETYLFWLPLDSGERFQFRISGVVTSFSYSAYVMAIMEGDIVG